MPARRGGGGGGPIKSAAGFLFAAMVAVAVLKGMPSDPEGFKADLNAKENRFEAFIHRVVDWVGISEDGTIKPGNPLGDAGKPAPKPGDPAPAQPAPAQPAPAQPAPAKPAPAQPAPAKPVSNTKPVGNDKGAAARASLNRLKVAPAPKVAYDRDEWRHWDNIRSCWTVREQVLVRDAIKGSVTMLDRDGKRTANVNAACEITGGEWLDPYTNQVFTNPEDLDIDHMVALGEAAKSGGQKWNKDKKRDYANYLADRHHLIAVSASANRAKGDKTPASWQPKNKAYRCTYATHWIAIKGKWTLTITESEKTALSQMLDRC